MTYFYKTRQEVKHIEKNETQVLRKEEQNVEKEKTWSIMKRSKIQILMQMSIKKKMVFLMERDPNLHAKVKLVKMFHRRQMPKLISIKRTNRTLIKIVLTEMKGFQNG